MKKISLFFIGLISFGGAAMAQPSKATLIIETDQPQATIHKEIYGQFAEHLGAGIYGGNMGGERF
jgi:alpha-N-arabinofuranosidase